MTNRYFYQGIQNRNLNKMEVQAQEASERNPDCIFQIVPQGCFVFCNIGGKGKEKQSKLLSLFLSH